MAGRRPSQPKAGTFGALVEEYRSSPEFLHLALKTRTEYQRRLNRLAFMNDYALDDIRSRNVKQLRDKYADRPAAAGLLVALMSVLLNFAVDREYLQANVAARVKKPPIGRNKRWSDEDVDLITTKAKEPIRRAALLAVETGQRLGDLIAMTWTQWDGRGFRLKQQKTGIELYVPASARLLPELLAWRATATAITVLTGPNGASWNLSTIKNYWQFEMQRLGLKGQGLVFHGLRATLASRLAEQGATTHEIAAITGHQTLSMIERYTKDADQERRAAAAVIKLDFARRPPAEGKVPTSD